MSSQDKEDDKQSVNRLVNLLTTSLKGDEDNALAEEDKKTTKETRETKDRDQAFLRAAFDSRDNTLLGLAHQRQR